MVEFGQELAFGGSNCETFEDYVLAVAQTPSKEYSDLSDMRVSVMNHDKCRIYAGDCVTDVANRKSMKSLFNRLLDTRGVVIGQDADKLHVLLVYLGIDTDGNLLDDWSADFEYMISVLSGFCTERSQLLLSVTHTHTDTEDDLEDAEFEYGQYPHMYILYSPSSGSSCELETYLNAYIRQSKED